MNFCRGLVLLPPWYTVPSADQLMTALDHRHSKNDHFSFRHPHTSHEEHLCCWSDTNTVNHHTLAIAAFATLLTILFCVALVRFESSLLSDRFVYFQQADSTSKSSLDANIGVISSSLPTIQKAVASKAPD